MSNPFGRRQPPPGTRRQSSRALGRMLEQTEAQFVTAVIDLAHLLRWHAAHFRPARTEHGWVTPMEGDPGFPDLALARDGWVLLRECKTDATKSQPTPEQVSWVHAAGPFGGIWRPADLRSGLIKRELTDPATAVRDRLALADAARAANGYPTPGGTP